jgi:hypothetical protein
MPTYDINGYTYRSPKELTESELLDLAKNLKESGALDPEVRKQEISGKEELKANPGLLNAYKTYYKRINGEDFKGTPDELVGEYMQQMRDWNLNTGSLMALSGRLAGNTFSEQERQAISIMWDTWDRVVPFYRQKDGKWQGLVDSFQSLVTDPTNLVGLVSMGTGTAAAAAAREAAKQGVRQAIKTFAVQGAKVGVIQGGIDGAVTNTLEQNVKTDIGLQDEFSVGQLAGATALGAGGGAVIGGGLGTAQGALKGRRAKQPPAQAVPDQNITSATTDVVDGVVVDQGTRTMQDATEGLSAANKFAQDMNDPAVKAAARAQAREDFLNNVSLSSKEYIEKNGDLNSKVTFEEAKGRVGTLFDRLGIEDYNNLDDVAEKLATSFNSGKLDVTDLSTLTAGVIGTETHAFRKFQEAFLSNSPDTVKAFETFEKVTRLSAHLSNQQARSTAFQAKRFRDVVDPITYAQAIELAAKQISPNEARTFEELLNNKIKLYGNKAVGALNEFWVHNILGAPKTLALNVLGGLSVAISEPGSRALGGLLSGDKALTRTALKEWTTMVSTIHQSAFYALKSFYASKTFIDGRTITELAEKNQDIFIGDADVPLHQMLMPWKIGIYNTLGNLNRFIGKRGMQATDELLKQMAFRSRVMALSIDDGLAKGMSYGDAVKYAKDASAKAIEDQLDAVAQGKVTDNPIAQKAVDYARFATFQNDLPDDAIGAVGKSLSTFRNNHPLFTQIMPFIRTPFNLIEFHASRMPILQNFTDNLRSKIQAGGKQAAEAEAAIHIGTLVLGSAIMLAFTDQMEGGQSGSGFKPEGGRAGVLRASGVQPNSILIDSATGERIRIDRLDPWARHFTLMGKIKDIYKYGTKNDQDAVMAGLVAAFATNFGEMSTLGGIKQVIDAFQSEKSLGQAAGERVGTMVPYFRLMQDVFGEDYKVAYDIVDNIYKSVPGLNNDLDLRRHPVFGTKIERLDTLGFPMSPIPKSLESQDMVDQELIRLAASIRPPEAKLFDGRIDLTKIKHPNGRTAYDRYQELAGIVKGPDGKNLYEKMREVIEDPRYWSTATDPQSQIGTDEEGGKVAILKKVIKSYRDAALKYMAQEEIKGLDKKINDAYRENRTANSIPGQTLLEQQRLLEQQ